MGRAGVVVSLDSVANLALVAPRDHCVDEAIAPAVGEVGVGESHQLEARQIIWKTKVEAEDAANRSTRVARVSLEHGDLLHADQFVGPDFRADLCGALRSDVSGKRPV